MDKVLKKESIINKFSIILIIGFAFIGIVLATLTPPSPIGESDDYMLSTIALEKRLSLKILPEDVEQAAIDFPEFAEYFRTSYEESMPTTIKGDKYPWYFGTYSVACIPVKQMLGMLGLNQSYAFAITNILSYVCALLFVYFKLNRSRRNVFLTILLLICSPTILYYFWPSAEIFIFSLLVISLVYFSNGNHKMAGLVASIAGTLNPAVMAYGAIIIIDYFLELIKDHERNIGSIINKLKENILDIVKLGICFIPCLIPYILNYFRFGHFTIQTAVGGFIDNSNIFNRFISYLFDLNLGIFPYFPILLIMFIAFSIYGICRGNKKSYLYTIAFIGVVMAYSIMAHINSGMTGIARYNAWSFPILVFYLTTQVEEIIKNDKLRRLIRGGLLLSAILSLSILKIIAFSTTGLNYMAMSPIAIKVLDNYPQLYNPFPYTFISRVNHVDGGYYYEKPVIYLSSEGYVRKILVTPETVDQVYEMIEGNSADLHILKQQVDKIKNSSGFKYINMNKNTKLVIKQTRQESFNPQEVGIDADAFTGVYASEGTFSWIQPYAKIVLAAGNKHSTGMKIIYATHPELFSSNRGKQILINVCINGVPVVVNHEVKETGFEEVKIPAEILPAPINDKYEIEITTNCYFNPYDNGTSSDKRDLSIMISYIGSL